MLKVVTIAVLCLAVGAVAGRASASITITESSMDFQLVPDPTFDNDFSAIWFTETTGPYLRQDASDAAKWLFEGQRDYRPEYVAPGTNQTWFLKTGDETELAVHNTIVNNTSLAFDGYTIRLYVATLVTGSLDVDGVGYTMELDASQDYWGNIYTTISLTFDTQILPGESFDLSYVMDLGGVVPPPPPDGGFSTDEGPQGGDVLPEPGALVVLSVGGITVLARRRSRRS